MAEKQIKKKRNTAQDASTATTAEAKASEQPGFFRKHDMAIKIAIGLLFFGYIFSLALNFSLNDPDLWWHLKTGRYIIDNWTVPVDDPFAYTTPKPLAEGQRIGLRSQWLGQVALYLSYSIGGYLGIGVFRNLLIILPMLVLYIWLVEKGLNPFVSILITALSSLMFSVQLFYAFERPQGLTFYISLLVILVLDRLRSHARQGHLNPERAKFDISFWILPLLMTVWSNIHAGFIIGNVVIMAYLFGEAVRISYAKIRGKSMNEPYIKYFFIVGFAALVASSFNPNSYTIFFGYLKGLVSMLFQSLSEQLSSGSSSGDSGWVSNVVLEYKTLYYFYKNLEYKWLIFYWVFIGALYFFMIAKYIQQKSFDYAEFIVVSLISFIANYYARFLMASLTILPFYMGKTILELRFSQLKPSFTYRTAVAALLVLSIGFATFTYNRTPFVFNPRVTTDWVSPWYPSALADFVKQLKIPPPMYNFYTWGGFLIWKMHPEYKVFIDGRALDDATNKTADAILKTFPGWMGQLDAYGINFIVIPVVFRESGHIIPLAAELTKHDNWKLIYLKYNGAVFVRNIPLNKAYIDQFNIDKKNIFHEIIQIEEIFLSFSPFNPVYNIAKADALMSLGFHNDAKSIYLRFPSEGSHGLAKLKELGY